MLPACYIDTITFLSLGESIRAPIHFTDAISVSLLLWSSEESEGGNLITIPIVSASHQSLFLPQQV